MNYKAQFKLMERILAKHTTFKRHLRLYKRTWQLTHQAQTRIIVGGQPISDFVISKLDLS
jgi:hypothetical protein